MKSRLFLLLTALLVIATPDHAADFRKMSAHVRGVLIRQEVQPLASRSTGTARHACRRLTAFVRIDPAKADEVWREYDCRCYSQMGDIAIVSIPIDRLGQLSDHPSVRRIEASPSGRADMDTTAIVVSADRLAALTTHLPSPTSFSGRGIVVGIMDVGFDLTHPNFYDSTATRYRIGAFWDQLSKDTIGSTLPVGRDYVGHDVVLAQQHSTDGLIQTHGTHTLGIAAGSGYDSHYRGIAYDADICLVNNAVSDDIELIDSADIDKYTTAVDALGFKYIFDYADRQGKPCVASFSEGYSPMLDEEDSLFSNFLDRITGPGRIIVASAGNECITGTYFEKPKGQQAAGAFIRSGNNSASYRLKADGPLWLSLYAYTEGSTPTHTLRFTSATFQQDSLLTDTLLIGADTCAVTIERYPSTFGSDTIYSICLDANKSLASLPPLAVVTEGTESRLELYGSSSNGLANNDIDTRWNAAEKTHNIHAPACFPSVICVGATAHRLRFTNYRGEYKDYSGGRTAGQWSPYSSVGPTISGSLKPDVVAPGDNIISSYSSYYIENNPDANDINSDVRHFEFQNRTYAWNANTGTSMATPVVAGVIALWLQAKPDLTTAEVLEVLGRTCRHPEEGIAYPNSKYGYGEIDAYHGLLDILGVDAVKGISTHTPKSLHISYNGGQLLLHTDAALHAPVRIKFHTTGGILISKTSITPEASCDAPLTYPLSSIHLKPGIYIVQIDTADSESCGSQVLVIQ